MRRIASTGGAAIIYDNVSAAGTVVDEYGSGVQISGAPWSSPRFCYNGIYLDMTTDNVEVFYIAL
jgi:hypothetical protein